MENRYYPIFMNIKGRLCVVIGGGIVALRKVEALIPTGAKLRVVAPEIMDEIISLGLETRKKEYEKADIKGASLVFAATGDEGTNQSVFRDAEALNIMCNVVDRPELCSFIVPSVIERGPIKIAISTGGVSPALSKRLRKHIGNSIGPEYEKLALLLGRLRPIVLAQPGGHAGHKQLFNVLLNSQLLEAIKFENKDLIDHILLQALGIKIDLEGIL